MDKKYATWKDSGESISFEGTPEQIGELERLINELPLIGGFPINVSFSKQQGETGRKKVVISPLRKFGGISCLDPESGPDPDSPIKFVAMEKDTGYIELAYKDYNIWIYTHDRSA